MVLTIIIFFCFILSLIYVFSKTTFMDYFNGSGYTVSKNDFYWFLIVFFLFIYFSLFIGHEKGETIQKEKTVVYEIDKTEGITLIKGNYFFFLWRQKGEKYYTPNKINKDRFKIERIEGKEITLKHIIKPLKKEYSFLFGFITKEKIGEDEFIISLPKNYKMSYLINDKSLKEDTKEEKEDKIYIKGNK